MKLTHRVLPKPEPGFVDKIMEMHRRFAEAMVKELEHQRAMAAKDPSRW